MNLKGVPYRCISLDIKAEQQMPQLFVYRPELQSLYENVLVPHIYEWQYPFGDLNKRQVNSKFLADRSCMVYLPVGNMK